MLAFAFSANFKDSMNLVACVKPYCLARAASLHARDFKIDTRRNGLRLYLIGNAGFCRKRPELIRQTIGEIGAPEPKSTVQCLALAALFEPCDCQVAAHLGIESVFARLVEFGQGARLTELLGEIGDRPGSSLASSKNFTVWAAAMAR